MTKKIFLQLMLIFVFALNQHSFAQTTDAIEHWLPLIFDLENPLSIAKITINVANSKGTLNRVWAGTDIKHIARTLVGEVQSAMDSASRTGFKYIRLRQGIIGGEMYGANSTVDTNFTNFDLRIAPVLNRGLIPIVVLEGAPAYMVSNQCDTPSHVISPNSAVYPPQDVNGYIMWQELVRKTIEHCKNKWGSETIKKWYFEVWNEPDAYGNFVICQGAPTLEK